MTAQKKPFIFHAEDKFLHFWDALVLLCTFIYCVETPVAFVFNVQPGIGYVAYDLALSCIYMADVAIRFRTARFINGKLVDDINAISSDYRKNGFRRDIFTMLPIVSIAFSLGAPAQLAHILGLVRVVRLKLLIDFTARAQNNSKLSPAFVKIASLLFWVLISAHWIACGWILTGAVSDKYGDGENYLRALYWCITTLATVGYGDITPQNPVQMVYTICIMIAGAGMYGLIIGNVSNILAKRDAAKVHFQEKVEKINAFMKYRSIPNTLQRRVNGYYRYLWESRLGYDEAEVMADLPGSLKEEIVLFLNRELVERVAFLKDAGPNLIRDVVAQLRPVVFTPEDCVFKAGDVGHCMYFILRGKVEVTSRDGATVFATLGDGSYFGEMSLLLSQPRSASVRAIDYCDMYMLEKESFEHVLVYYPEFAAHIKELAEERARQQMKTAAA